MNGNADLFGAKINIDAIAQNIAYKQEQAILRHLGIEEEPEELLYLHDELNNVISIVRKKDLSTVKTFRREELPKVKFDIHTDFFIDKSEPVMTATATMEFEDD